MRLSVREQKAPKIRLPKINSAFKGRVSYISGQKKQDTSKWNFGMNVFPYQGKKGKPLSINIKQFSDHHK